MKILFPKSLCLALGLACLPALAVAQSYLPLPETSAPVYRPVSSYYAQSTTTGSSLINHVAEPPVAEVNEVPSPSDSVVMPSPAASYGKSVLKGGKGCLSGCCGKGHGCWYGGAYGIFLDRDNEREMQITVYNTNERDAILSNRSADMETTAGFEFTIGRLLNCGTSAMELTYWQVDPSLQRASVIDTNGAGTDPDLLASFDLSTLNYDDGLGGVASLDGWVDAAQVHQVTRNWDIRNLEVNFLHHTCCGTWGGGKKCGTCCGRYEVSLLAGFRHLRFDDYFLFEADEDDTLIDGTADEVRYLIDLENRLYGFQMGCRTDYYHNCRLGLHAAGKFGIYANDIDHWSFIGGERGAAVVGAGPNAGREFDIRSDKTEMTFMSELDLGVSYRLSCRWRATAGYRVIAISGVALTDEQVPVYFQDIDGVANIDSERSLILHGGYAGLEMNY